MALIKLDDYYPNYREDLFKGYDIKSFEVIARKDEKVGSVEAILVDEDSGRFRYLIVDTGFWLFGKKVLLPIGLAFIVDMDRHVYVEALTKEQVKELPEYDENVLLDPQEEERIRSAYRPLVKNAIANQVNNPATYDLDQEPYFYEIESPNLKAVQERLINAKKH